MDPESGNGKAAPSSGLSESKVEQHSGSPLQLGAEQSQQDRQGEDEHRHEENEYEDGYNPVDLEVIASESTFEFYKNAKHCDCRLIHKTVIPL
jgi:hypothetical protein